MCVLWSRGRHPLFKSFRKCRCYTCLANPSNAALLRKPSTKSMLYGFRNCTTLWYSTIIATAATADALYKRKRREELNCLISDAERVLDEGERLRNRADVKGNRIQNGFMPVGLPAFYKQSYPESLERTRENLLQPEHDIGSVMRAIQLGLDTRVNSRHCDPRSMYAPPDPAVNPFATWTPKKLVTTELSIAKLATKLMIQLKETNSEEDTLEPDQKREVETLKRSLHRLNLQLEDIKLKGAFDVEGIERVRYPQYTTTDSHELSISQAIKALNKTLMKILRRDEKRDSSAAPADMIHDVVYALLTSPIAPEIKGYTLMISKLSKAGHFKAVDAIVTAFFESHQRPNEMFVTATLAHYARSGSFNHFNNLVDKIDNKSQGLMLAQPGIRISQHHQDRLREVNGKVRQSITLTPEVFYTMIQGFVTVGHISLAHWIEKRMREYGFEEDLPTLNCFLGSFAKRGQWDQGWEMWRSIQERFFRSPSSESEDNTKTRPLILGGPEHSAYSHALKLCKKCSQPTEFTKIYKEALSRGLPMPSLLLRFEKRVDTPYVTFLRRQACIASHMSKLHECDIQKWSLQLSASRMLLDGISAREIAAAFAEQFQTALDDVWSYETDDTPRAFRYTVGHKESVNLFRPSREALSSRTVWPLVAGDEQGQGKRDDHAELDVPEDSPSESVSKRPKLRFVPSGDAAAPHIRTVQYEGSKDRFPMPDDLSERFEETLDLPMIQGSLAVEAAA